jgi:hypothetical protein
VTIQVTKESCGGGEASEKALMDPRLSPEQGGLACPGGLRPSEVEASPAATSSKVCVRCQGKGLYVTANGIRTCTCDPSIEGETTQTAYEKARSLAFDAVSLVARQRAFHGEVSQAQLIELDNRLRELPYGYQLESQAPAVTQDEVRNAALEEAALICNDFGHGQQYLRQKAADDKDTQAALVHLAERDMAWDCAREIRKLKSSPTERGETARPVCAHTTGTCSLCIDKNPEYLAFKAAQAPTEVTDCACKHHPDCKSTAPLPATAATQAGLQEASEAFHVTHADTVLAGQQGFRRGAEWQLAKDRAVMKELDGALANLYAKWKPAEVTRPDYQLNLDNSERKNK